MGKKKKKQIEPLPEENQENSLQEQVMLQESSAQSMNDPEAEVFVDFAPGPVWHISVLSGVLIFLIIVYKVYFAFFAS